MNAHLPMQKESNSHENDEMPDQNSHAFLFG
jgi:hypothetical protein